MINDLPVAEYRFKRNWETRREGWVQAKTDVSNGWVSIKYCRSLKAADRFVRKVIARREEPDTYIQLPIIRSL